MRATREQLDAVHSELTEHISHLLAEIPSPVLNAEYDRYGQVAHYDDPVAIASIIADDHKHQVICGTNIELVKEDLVRLVKKGYSWLGNNVEFMLISDVEHECEVGQVWILK